MTAAAQAFETFLPFWRASIPPSIPLAYFDAFVLRMRPTLETIVGGFFERRQARRDQSLPPESMTKASRTRRNLEAMRIVATRRPQDMTAEERRTVLGYSGWGGLSIEAVMDQFPPGLVPDDFALAHEYFTPPRVAENIADLVCRWLADLAGHDGIVRALEPSVGIGRMILANGPPRCLVTDPRYKETRWTAVELSEVSAKMFAAMRPDVELFSMSLERWMSEHAARYQGTLGYVVANPPYGDRGEYARQDKHPDYQERAAYAYFMRRCLDLLVPRGLGVFVIPAGFLTGSTNRKLRERVLLRHHLEVAFRLPSEGSTGKDLFPGAHNVVDVLFWRARGGELRQVDPSDGFILEGDYFKEHPAHILGIEVEEEAGKKRRRYAVVGDFTGFPAFTPRPVCESCAITNLPTFEVTPVTTVTRDMGEDPGDAGDDLRQALELGRRVDRYLALVAAEDPRAIGLWRELSEALQNLKRAPALAAHDGNPWRWPELRALAERRALAQRLLAAYQKTGELAPAVAQAPNIQPKFRAQPGDVLAQTEHLHRSRRRLTIDELEAFHKAQGGLLDRGFMVRQLLDAEWNLDGDDWDELVPARAYLGGMLWPKYDRAAVRAATDPQAEVQMRRLEGAMNLAVFEDIRDISPRQGWVPPALVSAWLSDTLNRRYGAITLVRAGGTIQPEGSDYAKLGTSTALTPETLWCLGWMNHDFTLFKPDLSDGEIQKLVEEDEAATGQSATPGDTEDEETDEEEDLGQVRLLLGRHWDRQFTAWVRAHEDRRDAVRTAYNRSFRGIVIATYEGGTLDIARWNEGGPQLKPHQIAGILRVLDMRGGLIAFDVGVGKTYTAIGVIAAARQEGWVRRPVVLVPSSLVWKWHDDFLCVLPDYRVLVIGSNRKRITRGKRKGLLTSETDTPEERAAKWSAFQAGLYDVVILSYDALARTKMNQEALLEYVKTVESLQRQVKLRQRNAAKKKVEDLSERDRAILKHGVRAFVEEMLELPDGHKFDPGIAWDDIGIDMLIVDEAAAFKNSYKPEAREHGLPKFMGSGGDGSKRAWQLDFRAAAVRQRTGGSGIVLLTATPAKNSPLEFYNLIQLIDPHAFSSRGLMDPEQFIDRFLRIESREIIDMQPSDVDAGAGWPDEDEAELQNVLESHIAHVLRERAATYEDLGWLAASDAWLTRWWPRVEKQVREGLATSTAEQVYPVIVDGALTLASSQKLRGGELLAPTLAGWQQFLALAPTSALKYGELREAGLEFWARKFPRGLLGTQGAETEAEGEADGAAKTEASSTSLDPQQAEVLQTLLDRDSKRAREDGTSAEVDRRVLDNLMLQRAAMTDALSMGGGGKAEFEQVGRRFMQTAERITIVRAVAAVLRGRGYQAVMSEGDAQMLNVLGKSGRLLGAATQGGVFRHAPGLTGEALAQVERDVADAHRIVKAIILDEAQTRGPKVSEAMMLAVWQRARAQVTEPTSKATASVDLEEARMGELLRRGRDDEESRWAAAVERGTAMERARGLSPEAARKAAIQNLAANMDHYGAAAAAAPSPSPARPAAPTSAHQDARSALKALALPPKKYAYFVHRADEAIEAGKAWSPVVARARRVAEKLGGPPKPAQKPPTRQPKPQAPKRPPAVDTTIDSFNSDAGWRAEKLRARPNGYVLAIYPEGKDTPVASVDVLLGDVDETRWLDERLTQNERDTITERLGRALWEAHDDDDDDDDAEQPPSPLQDLIDLMDRRSTALGARPANTGNLARKDGFRPIAEALRDLAKPSGPSADELQRWLESEDLMSAGEVVGRARGSEPVPPRQLLRDLWSAVFEVLTLEDITGRPGALTVPSEAIFSEDNSDFILQRVRQGEHFIVRRIRIRTLEHDEETGVTTIEDPTDRLAPEATVHRAERAASFFVELYGKLGAFQEDLERAPRTLQDVRTLLYWSAVMLDAPLCQGQVKARAAAAFTQAKAYHDTARQQQLEGRSVDAVRRLHEAMRRISSAAAEIARSCAEGQIDLGTTPDLPVRPEDQATIERRD